MRGGLLFTVPLLRWPAKTRAVVNDLLAVAGAAPLGPVAVGPVGPLLGWGVGAGYLLLWSSYVACRQPRLARTDVLEVLLLTGLLVALPPMLSAGAYFVGWHSLRHVLLLSVALLVASVVTLPHAVLVTLGLDAALWRQKADLRGTALITSSQSGALEY